MIYPRTSTENVTSDSPQLSPKGRHNTRDAAARVKRGERETKRRDATRGLPRRSPILVLLSPNVTTGINPTGVPYVRVLFLVPGGKVHQELIHFRVYQAEA